MILFLLFLERGTHCGAQVLLLALWSGFTPGYIEAPYVILEIDFGSATSILSSLVSLYTFHTYFKFHFNKLLQPLCFPKFLPLPPHIHIHVFLFIVR